MEDQVPELVPIVEFNTRSVNKDIPKIPVTILTGFLGAGKSTLLSRILNERHGWRVAIVMNELGPNSSVDRAIIQEQSGVVDKEWLEVENGCLCCTAKNETFLAIESLLNRRSDIEHIIIEASGAADPSILVQKLWVDEALESKMVLDAVICVVDGSRTEEIFSSTSLHYAVEAARQLAIADLVLLNKMDLVEHEKVSNLERILRTINPCAKILPTLFSVAPLEEILFLQRYNSSNNNSSIDPHKHAIDDLLFRANSISLESHSSQVIRSFTLYFKGLLDYHKFERWLFTLLWERRIEEYAFFDTDLVLRVKGIVLLKNLNSPPQFYYLQAVQDKYELEPFKDQSTLRDTAIIFIGRIDRTTESIIKSTVQAQR